MGKLKNIVCARALARAHYMPACQTLQTPSDVQEKGVCRAPPCGGGLYFGQGCRQELAPFDVVAIAQPSLDGVVGADVGPARSGAQSHTRLFGRAAAFAVVTIPAGADEIFPAVGAATMAWHHMVERQIVSLLPAILETKSIPP